MIRLLTLIFTVLCICLFALTPTKADPLGDEVKTAMIADLNYSKSQKVQVLRPRPAPVARLSAPAGKNGHGYLRDRTTVPASKPRVADDQV